MKSSGYSDIEQPAIEKSSEQGEIMSTEIMDYMILTTLTVTSLLIARGVVFHALAFFFPAKHITLSYTDKDGVKHTKSVHLSEDDELIKVLEEVKTNARYRKK